MYHPGLLADNVEDEIDPARYAEYRYLSGNRFIEDCQHHQVTLYARR
jgi:hypothetical protein